MKYKIVLELSERQLQDITFPLVGFKPIYKKKPDSNDDGWIIDRSDFIIDSHLPANEIYDLYCRDFKEEIILNRYTFYKRCRELLRLDMKIVRNNDQVNYCFKSR